MTERPCKCGIARRPGGTDCQRCHAARMRVWRKRHPLNDEQRRRDKAKLYLATNLKRGKVEQQPCIQCCLTNFNSVPFWEDYDRPLCVTWLCRRCRRRLIRERQSAAARKNALLRARLPATTPAQMPR